MFGRTPKDLAVKLDLALDNLLIGMDLNGVDSEKYPELLSYLERVNTIRKSEDRKKVNPDTIALVAGNLLGILVIVAYEQKHVMTSKGLSFILKSH